MSYMKKSEVKINQRLNDAKSRSERSENQVESIITRCPKYKYLLIP